MRGAFVRTLTDLAAGDERILLLTGDLGFMALEPFQERFPKRFFNIGVAEQNMIGVATGLADAGFIPFAYSIATFATLRPYEFIRNGPIWHGLPVRIVGIGGGRGKGVLIVDDLVDTGKTATVVREVLPEAHFATVYAKPMGRPMVDTFITEVSQDTWIHFPWDTGLAFQPPIRGEAR